MIRAGWGLCGAILTPRAHIDGLGQKEGKMAEATGTILELESAEAHTGPAGRTGPRKDSCLCAPFTYSDGAWPVPTALSPGRVTEVQDAQSRISKDELLPELSRSTLTLVIT